VPARTRRLRRQRLAGAAFKDSIEPQFERWAKIVKATGFSAE
jgi:hypothetical protein